MHYEWMVQLTWAGVVFAYLGTRVAEWRLHRTNYEFLAAIGSEEHLQHLTRTYYFLGWALVPVAVTEAIYFQRVPPIASVMVASGLLLIGLGLRLWAIRSLGFIWTMRCLAIPGYKRVRSGAYRWFRHPEYIGRLVEGLGLCLIFHSIVTAIAFFIVNSVTWRLIASREDQLLTEHAMDSL